MQVVCNPTVWISVHTHYYITPEGDREYYIILLYYNIIFSFYYYFYIIIIIYIYISKVLNPLHSLFIYFIIFKKVVLLFFTLYFIYFTYTLYYIIFIIYFYIMLYIYIYCLVGITYATADSCLIQSHLSWLGAIFCFVLIYKAINISNIL